MKLFISFVLIIIFVAPLKIFALDKQQNEDSDNSSALEWKKGMNIDSFWLMYADSKGGLTWGKSAAYPEYKKVKEGDTILIQVTKGLCLMEFFHGRWRRANDVRRWHDDINQYSGCLSVFD
jgi:hypothetical protein